MNDKPNVIEELPKEDVKDRSTGVPDVPIDNETSSGGENSGTEREPQRQKAAPDLDPNNTD